MVTFDVRGKPEPEGSTKGYIYGGRVKITHQNGSKLMAWRESISEAYRQSGGNYHHDSPIAIVLVFHFLRPKSVSAKKRPFMTVKPDLDKLSRGAIDALTQVAFDDDSQVVRLMASKDYADWEGVTITVEEIE